MLKLDYKIRGFTLVETIVSLLIILSVFAIGMMILINIMKSDRNQEKLEVMEIMNQVYYKTISEKIYLDEVMSHDDYQIIKEFVPYKSSDNLLILSIEIRDNKGNRLASRKEVRLIKWII